MGEGARRASGTVMSLPELVSSWRGLSLRPSSLCVLPGGIPGLLGWAGSCGSPRLAMGCRNDAWLGHAAHLLVARGGGRTGRKQLFLPALTPAGHEIVPRGPAPAPGSRAGMETAWPRARLEAVATVAHGGARLCPTFSGHGSWMGKEVLWPLGRPCAGPGLGSGSLGEECWPDSPGEAASTGPRPGASTWAGG